ncbi:MAG: hypothetical protein V7638_3838 [Acidobacteriota bacterium]
MRTLLLLALLTLFSFSIFEPSAYVPPVSVQMPMYYEVRGQVRIYDGLPFAWSLVNVFDAQENLLYTLQLDDEGGFLFPGLTGETYLVRGAQDGYGYAPPEIKLTEITGPVSGLLTYAGPNSWFPPLCILPRPITNAPCYVPISTTATDTEGNSVTSEPIRIYFHPSTNPSPSPTPEATATPTPSTPTPTPTPIATATPTPTPTPVSTPTPTPTPTATPTPTPGPCTTLIGNGKKCKPGCVCIKK